MQCKACMWNKNLPESLKEIRILRYNDIIVEKHIFQTHIVCTQAILFTAEYLVGKVIIQRGLAARLCSCTATVGYICFGKASISSKQELS